MTKQMLDMRMPEAPNCTYRRWIHMACFFVFNDSDHYTDEQLDSMTDEELTALEWELQNSSEGSSQDGTH